MTETIETERLELVWLSPQLVEAILDGRHDELGFTVPDGWPDAHDRRFLAYRLRQMGSDEALGRWLLGELLSPGGQEAQAREARKQLEVQGDRCGWRGLQRHVSGLGRYGLVILPRCGTR